MTTRHRNGLLALAAIALVAGCGTGTSTQPRIGSTSSTSTSGVASASIPSTAPSQSPADARRDGVIAELAALPFAVRVDVQRAVPAAEGVWVLSRPTAAAKRWAHGCRLGPETGKYPTTTICTTEYGEVLLLDSARTRILRAYPLPAVPARFLRVTSDAVWCGRPGDTRLSATTLPDAMVCRIDRQTLRAEVRVFAPGEESEVMQPCFFPPANWTVQRGRLAMTDLAVDGRGLWARSAAGTWTRLDRRTLAVVARNVSR